MGADPKSGTTWTQNIVATLVTGGAELGLTVEQGRVVVGGGGQNIRYICICLAHGVLPAGKLACALWSHTHYLY